MTAPHNDSTRSGDTTRDKRAAAHTAGPWTSQGWVPTWAYIPVKDARHNIIASMYPDTSHGYSRDEVEANASVIIAAPELLASLRELVNAYDAKQLEMNSPDVSQDESHGVHPWHEEWLHHARAAIAKATEPPHG